jgi:phosphate transport system permease protein
MDQVTAAPGSPTQSPFADVDLGELERSLMRPRTLMGVLLDALVAGMTLFALVPLFSVVVMLAWRGGKRLQLSLFTQLPPAPLEAGGGFGNAVVGTLFMVGIATALSVPVAILSAIHLAQAGESRLASAVRFAGKVLTGFPSILAGVFAYGAVVLVTGTFSPMAGGVALSILMLPTVMLTAEEAIRAVPAKMKEAAIGMGATSTHARSG